MRVIPSAETYARAFTAEQARTYPRLDAVEAQLGYAVGRDRLEAAARVLACPIKVHPPNWQHGRVLYALARQRLALATGSVQLLDIGTAKGFSALCLQWALQDAGVDGQVISVDVVDPASHAIRNTIGEVDGLKTLAELLEPWPETRAIQFWHATGLEALALITGEIAVAFVDGKHLDEIVYHEGYLLARHQRAGDVVVFDDVHIPGVAAAVARLGDRYRTERLFLSDVRAYALGWRR